MKKFLMILMTVFLLMPLSVHASELNDENVADENNIPTCPTVKSFSVSHDEQKNYTFTAVIEDNGFEILDVGFGLKNKSADNVPNLNFGLFDKGEGIYQLTFNFSDSYAPEYELAYFSINVLGNVDPDTYSTTWYYTKDGSEYEGETTQIIEDYDESLDPMKIDGVVATNEKPVLMEYEFEEDVMYVPDSVYWNIKVKGVASPIAVIEVVFGDSEGTCINPEELEYRYERDYAMEKAGSVVDDFGQLSSSGLQEDTTYYFKSIKLIDVFGNESIYSIDAEDEAYRLDKTELKVVNNRIYDVLLDLDDMEFLSKLESVEDGSVALIDSYGNTQVPAEFFSIIKEKNITAIFEKLNSDSSWENDGIQWVIKGEDVNTKDIKDIDVSVEVAREYTPSPWLLYHEARHEQKMPRFQLEKYEVMDTYIKEDITEAGYGDIIKEVEKQRKPGEYFSETYMRLTCEVEFVKLTFVDNGKLPAKSYIRVKPGYTFNDENILDKNNVFLHYINPNSQQFELVQSGINRETDGYYVCTITHNSDYALHNEFPEVMEVEDDDDTTTNPDDTTQGDNSTSTTPDNTKPEDNKTSTETEKTESGIVKTGDVNNTFLYSTLLLAAMALVVSAFVYKKRVK